MFDQSLMNTALAFDGNGWEIRINNHIADFIIDRDEAFARFLQINSRYSIRETRPGRLVVLLWNDAGDHDVIDEIHYFKDLGHALDWIESDIATGSVVGADGDYHA